MKAFSAAIFGCWLMVSSIAVASSNLLIRDFALLDHSGKFHQLSYYGDQKALVLYSHSIESLKASGDLKSLVTLGEKFSADPVVFLLINSIQDDSRDAIAEDLGVLELGLPVLLDDTRLVSSDLNIRQAGEVLIIDPQQRSLLFRGPVVDAEPTLAAIVGNELPMKNRVSGDGSATNLDLELASNETISYTDEIVPILKDNCVKCHREGAIAPWAMSSHSMIKGFAPMIREVVMTRRMPPGQIDAHVGRPMINPPGLSVEETKKLVRWIDSGSTKDGLSDPLENVEPKFEKFTLGEPDLVLEVPAQSIPATGVIDYRYVPVPLNLDNDVWISGMEFLPGDSEVLHHVIAYLTSPADKSAKASSAGSGQNIAGFAPGRQPDYFGKESGRLIPKGSNLLLQMHYTTSGREAVDATRVGIFFHKKPPAYVMSGDVVGQRRFLIPPGAKEHKLEASREIERDALLYQFTPHMHFRGKYMSYEALYPDGTSEVLLSVPRYNFNWQYSYRPEEPVFLPAGTKLIAKGAMDNSDRNPANPDPTKPVFFGLQTMHEMFFGFVTLRYIGDTPETDLASEDLVSPSVGMD